MNALTIRTLPRTSASLRRMGLIRRAAVGGWVIVLAGVTPCLLAADPGDIVLRGHEGAVFAAQVTPDGERVVTAATDGTARLWDASTGQELRRFTGHTGPVTGVAVSADGRTLVTSSQDNSLRVWDLPLKRPLIQHQAHGGSAVAIALSADGRTILTAGADPAARLWDTTRLIEDARLAGQGGPAAPDGRGAAATFNDDSSAVRAVTWRADGAQFVTADDAGRIVLRSPFLDTPLGTWGVHGGGVVACAFMAGNPQQLLSAGRDGTLRLWQGPPPLSRSLPLPCGVRDLLPIPGQALAAVAREDGGLGVVDTATMQPIRDLPPGSPARALAATSDGATLVVGDDAGKLRWLNVADGADRGIVGGHQGAVLDVATIADGSLAFTAGADGTVRQWARPAPRVLLDGHTQGVKLGASAADGQWFATTGDDRTVRIWNGAGQPQRTIGPHPQALSALAISADGRGLAAGDAVGGVSIWNPQDGAAQGAMLVHQGAVRAIAPERDGSALWTAGADGTIKRTKLPLPVPRQLAGHTQPVKAIVTTADGRAAFTAGQDAMVRQWDVLSGQTTRTFGDGAAAGAVTGLAVSTDGSLVAAVTETGSVRAWRVADGAAAFVANVPGVALRDVAILPGGAGAPLVVTVGDDQRLRIWTLAAEVVADGKDVVPGAEIPLPDPGTDRLAICADGTWLVTCGAGRIVRRWRVSQEGVAPIDGAVSAGAARITDIAFSGDGAWFAACGEDGKVTLWDAGALLAAAGDLAPVRTLEAGGALRGVAFDATAPWVATASDDGTVAIWDPNTGRQVERFAATGGIAAVGVGSGTVLAAGADPAIRAWTPAVTLLIEVAQGAGAGVATALVALPGEEGIAALVTGDRELRRYSRDGRPLPGVLSADAALVQLVTSADGLRCVVATAAGEARTWEVATGTVGGPVALGAGVTPLALSTPESPEAFGQLLVADGLPRLRAIDPLTGASIEEMALPAPALVALSTGAAGQGPGGVGALGRTWVAFGAQPQGVLQPRSWVRTLLTAPAAVNAIVLAADGARLFAAGEDGRIVSLRTADGVSDRVFAGEGPAIRELALLAQPPAIAAACADGAVRIWSLGSEAEPRVLRQQAPLVSISASPDGNRLATLSEAGLVAPWSTVTDAPLQDFPGHAAGSGKVRFLPDNLSVMSGSTDRTIRLAKASALKSMQLFNQPIAALVTAGAQVVVAGNDGRVLLLDVAGNGPPRSIAEGLVPPLTLAARPDGQRLAIGSSTGIGIWETGGWKRLEELVVPGALASLAWSGDGRKLVAATLPAPGQPAAMTVFGPPPAPAAPTAGKEFALHQSIEADAAITALAVDGDGRGVWCTHGDGTLRQWGLAALDSLRRLDAGSPVLAVAISRDGGTVVSGGNDQLVRVWDPLTGQQRAQLTGHTGPVLALALSPDDALVVSASGDLTLRLWDVEGGRALKQVAATDEAVYSLSVHPSGRTVAAGGADRAVHLHDILTGGVERSFQGHSDFVHAVAFNRQGSRLLSYGYAGVLKVWNPADGALLHDAVVGRIGNAASWGAAAGGTAVGTVDDRIVVACGDGTVRIVVVPGSAR